MSEEKKGAGLYIRVFTEVQVCEGFSLPEQEKRLRAMCEYKGYEIYDVYEGLKISAETSNYRLEFERSLQDVRDKKINTIVVLKLDKLIYKNIGQMDFQVRYYDNEIKEKEDNSTIGIILCSDKKDTIVKYLVLNDNN